MTSRTYVGGAHNYAQAAAWSPAGKPQPGDNLFVDTGTVTAAGQDIEGQTIDLYDYGGNPVLILQNSTLGAGTTLAGLNDGGTPEIDTKGKITNAGLIRELDGVININQDASAVFLNQGQITDSTGIAPGTINIIGGTLKNSGTIEANGDGSAPGGTINLTGSLSNSGMIGAMGGTIDITPTGKMTNTGYITSAWAGRPGSAYTPEVKFNLSDTLNNAGHLVNTATMDFEAVNNATSALVRNSGTIIDEPSATLTFNTDVQQTQTGTIQVSCANLDVNGSLSGGTVQVLTTAMIEFGGPTTPNFLGTPFSAPGTDSSRAFSASLDLGQALSATLQFDGSADVRALLSGPDTLNIYSATPAGPIAVQIASLHLAGGAYTQDEFQTAGNGTAIQFTHT
jgi:hypothetical protein